MIPNIEYLKDKYIYTSLVREGRHLYSNEISKLPDQIKVRNVKLNTNNIRSIFRRIGSAIADHECFNKALKEISKEINSDVVFLNSSTTYSYIKNGEL